MKILHITHLSDIGGAEKMVLDLAAWCDPARFDVSITSMSGEGVLSEKARQLGITFHAIGRGHPLIFWRNFPALLKRERFDIIQTHGARAELTSLVAKSCRVPRVISTLHDVHGFENRAKKLFTLLTSPCVDAWVAVTPIIEQRALSGFKLSATKVKMIENGIDISSINQQSGRDIRAQHGITENQILILSVANLRPVKGFAHILSGITLLSERERQRYRFVFVGKDQSNGTYQHMAKDLGVNECIIFAGFQEHVVDYLHAADIFLLASESEGLPLSLLEALSSKTPAIATAVGGIPSVIENGKNGLLIQPSQPRQIIEAVRTLSSDPQRARQLAEVGYQTATNRFTVEGMVARYQELYESYRRA